MSKSVSAADRSAENAVRQVIHDYFDGLHFADTNLLEGVFSEDCVLKAPGIRRTRQQWLELVASRNVPAKLGTQKNYQILSLEVMGEQAMVKVLCPLLDDIFIDYLGLLFENGQWLIVNKMYAHQPE